jgi:hypothetical protein
VTTADAYALRRAFLPAGRDELDANGRSRPSLERVMLAAPSTAAAIVKLEVTPPVGSSPRVQVRVENFYTAILDGAEAWVASAVDDPRVSAELAELLQVWPVATPIR